MPHRMPRSVGFAVAALTSFGLLAAAGAPSPLYPVYQQLWNFSSFTLTVVFAVYVVALLATLLTVGSLSDHLGRRPVLIGGLLLLALSMLIFVHADGVGGLLLARVVQGIATGAVTGAGSALIVDLQPSERLGSMATSGAPSAGIACGLLLSGALVQHAPWPRYLIYWVLLAAYLVLAAALLFVPERRSDTGRLSRAELWRAVRPSVGVADPARAAFFGLVPALVATWALGGLYLSLGSSVVESIFGEPDHLVVGLALAAFFAPAAIVLPLIRHLPEPVRRPLGLAFLGGGVAVTVVGVLTTSFATYVVGSVVAGIGFGTTFLLAVGAIAAATPAAERAQTFATVFVVSYAAFSVPAVIAGLAVQMWGLRPTIVGYGVLELLLVAMAAALATRSTRRRIPSNVAA